MRKNYHKNYSVCFEKFSDIKLTKEIYLAIILFFGTGIFAFVS